MILTVDIGNTNTEYGFFEKDGTFLFDSRVETNPHRMCDEYAISLADILHLYGYAPEQVEGAIISSVVPPTTTQIKAAIEKICRCRVLLVSPGVKTGLNIRIDDPGSLGGDLAAVSVGAKKHYPLPVIIVDLGTATKILALDEKGSYRGGVIAPGVKISSEALASKTAALPLIGITNEPVTHVIGTNTLDAMRAGLLAGTACMIDGMVEKFEEELGCKCNVVATGGFSGVIKPLCRKQMTVDPYLVQKGLLEIYLKNT